MPLVLTQNELTESGHSYADELGVEYEDPNLYRSLIQQGEPFVYYRGRKRADGSKQPQVYLGSGVIGKIEPSPRPGLLICDIEDFLAFNTPVPFKTDGDYLEPLGKVPASKAGLYFRRGVREVDDSTFRRILTAADAEDPNAARRGAEADLPWASPELARLVDEIAMETAVDHLNGASPEGRVRRMPHNNPGYDVRIEFSDRPPRYVEVKGTIRVPHFFMSEGERLFSHRHADSYSLLIVYALDLTSRTGSVMLRDGAVAGDDLQLRPVTWEGALAEHGAASLPQD